MSSIFKIYSPEDCDFYYDGELKGHIYGNNERAFRFVVERRGTYRVCFINSSNKRELKMILSIDADEEQNIELDFNDKKSNNDENIVPAKNKEEYSKEEKINKLIADLVWETINDPKWDPDNFW